MDGLYTLSAKVKLTATALVIPVMSFRSGFSAHGTAVTHGSGLVSLPTRYTGDRTATSTADLPHFAVRHPTHTHRAVSTYLRSAPAPKPNARCPARPSRVFYLPRPCGVWRLEGPSGVTSGLQHTQPRRADVRFPLSSLTPHDKRSASKHTLWPKRWQITNMPGGWALPKLPCFSLKPAVIGDRSVMSTRFVAVRLVAMDEPRLS